MKLTQHRAHDYRFLIKRWRAVARVSGLVMRRYSEVGGYPVYYLRSKQLPASGAIYISAGIHGDEPGATEGCIAWAEKNVQTLVKYPFLIFPCLNPWGLVNNSRNDDLRRDLNRMFQHDEIPSLRVQKEIIKPFRFALALALHEDYDGQGVYIYGLERVEPFWTAGLIKAAAKFVPVEGRARVEKRVVKNGVFQRKKLPMEFFKKIGLPEAPYLHLHHSDRTFTIETPSEFALDRRVGSHVAIIEECVRRASLMEASTATRKVRPAPRLSAHKT